jgi:hypothetical protein
MNPPQPPTIPPQALSIDTKQLKTFPDRRPPGQANTPGSGETGANGSVNADQAALSGADHTRISTISAFGASDQAASAAQGSAVAVGSMVEGKVAVEVIDAILPGILVMAFYAGGVKLRKSEFQLTASEKATLTPLVQRCLDQLIVNFNNPWYALALTAGVIYGMKASEKGFAIMIDNKNATKEAEALKEKAKVVAVSDKPVSTVQDVLNRLPRPYTDEDIKSVAERRKKGNKDAVEWLNKKHNWNPN